MRCWEYVGQKRGSNRQMEQITICTLHLTSLGWLNSRKVRSVCMSNQEIHTRFLFETLKGGDCLGDLGTGRTSSPCQEIKAGVSKIWSAYHLTVTFGQLFHTSASVLCWHKKHLDLLLAHFISFKHNCVILQSTHFFHWLQGVNSYWTVK
jgi:hypothetical protein